MRKFQTVRDLAVMFQKHENTIYKWITADRLFPNAFKVKAGWYVPQNDVIRLMKSRRDSATPAPRSTMMPALHDCHR